MTLALPEFSAIPQSDVDQMVGELALRVAEENPNVQTRHGVLRSLLIHYAGAAAAGVKMQLDIQLASRSLLAVNENPEAADDDVVDHLLSNFNVTRRSATNARGSVTVLIDSPRTVLVAAGSLFDIGGVSFEAESVVQAKAEEELVDSSTDQLLVATSDGFWAMSVPVVAVEAGAIGLVRRDTLAVPATPPLGFVNAYAAADFALGVDAETTSELLERMRLGIAAKSPGNRLGAMAMVTANPSFSETVAMSIISGNDVEMLRSRHGLFPVSGGGKSDWYARTQLRLHSGAESVAASLLSVEASNRSVWTIAVPAAVAAGLYEVEGVRTTGAQTAFPASAVERSWRTDAEQDVANRVEGDFSAIQTINVVFTDTVKATEGLAVGDEANYELLYTAMPKIHEMQTTVESREVVPYGADALVRAPVPCFVTAILNIRKRVTYRDFDATAVRNAVADAVNRVGFVGALYGSSLLDAAHNTFTDVAVVSSLDLRGRILAPGGEEHRLRDPFALVVPHLPDECVTSRTVQFFLDPDDVQIVVENSGAV